MGNFTLSPVAEAAGYNAQSYACVSSTNIVAMESAQYGDIDKLWIVSNHQSAGKGRRGRVWQTEPGNLAASLVIKLPAATPSPEILGFVAGVALVNAVKNLIGERGQNLSLKWPNDLLLNNAKLAGILLESQKLDEDHWVVIVGMGLNITNAPGGLHYATISLAEIDPNISVQAAFSELSKCWVSAFDLWDFGKGRGEILRQWRNFAHGIGKPIAITRENDVLSGVFDTIDEQGRLIVALSSGKNEKITAGDVQF